MDINVPSMTYSYHTLDISFRDNKCNQQRSKSKPTSHLMIAYVAAAPGLNTN